MIKLKKILEEVLKVDKLNSGKSYISANDLSKKLEPNHEEIYDFGGGKFSPFGDKATIIDAFDLPKSGNPSNKIHDLNDFLSLPPKGVINMSYSFYNFQYSTDIKKTVNNALKPGGFLVIQDYNNTLNGVKSMFQSYDILYEYSYDEDEDDDGFYVIVFQK
tara:strand:- start:895 stop:1377 length:483 start_codon:yes stop_codon:yes gene_type:complete